MDRRKHLVEQFIIAFSMLAIFVCIVQSVSAESEIVNSESCCEQTIEETFEVTVNMEETIEEKVIVQQDEVCEKLEFQTMPLMVSEAKTIKSEEKFTEQKSLKDDSIQYKPIEEKLKELKTATNINMDVRLKCSLTKEQFIQLISDIKSDTRNVIKNNAEIIWDLGMQYNINPIFITAVIGTESGWGSSPNAIGKNNLFSISISADGKKMESFSSEEECIRNFVKLLDNQYLTETGDYYTGTTIRDINFFYCPKHAEDCDCFDELGNLIEKSCDFDYAWGNCVVDCMYTIYKSLPKEI